MSQPRPYNIQDKLREYTLGPCTATIRKEIKVWSIEANTWVFTGKFEMVPVPVSDLLK
jgi:hypothetical protein